VAGYRLQIERPESACLTTPGRITEMAEFMSMGTPMLFFIGLSMLTLY